MGSMMRWVGRSDRGATAVEAALVLPILLLIVFGIIDFGRMMNAQITLNEAAREGARAVALEANWQDRVDTAAQGIGGLAALDSTVETCGSPPTPDEDAFVRLDYTFSYITPVGGLAGMFAGGGFGADVILQGVGVMPCRA
jgi:hypothetical protein